jgi:hypothetical protein
MSKFPLTRLAVSAHSIVSREPEPCRRDTACLNPDPPVSVTSCVAPVATRSHESLLGALGVTVVIAILALAIYFVAKYLW